MSTSNSSSRSLSEIGHLFLTELRQKQGGPRPQRTPPPSQTSVHLTAEEFERACHAEETAAPADKPAPSVTALLSSHLLDRETHWIHAYARHAALGGERVGLIEISASELKVSCFDRAADFDAQAVHDSLDTAVEPLEPRRMAQAMEELAWDVDRWLLSVRAPRSAMGRNLFRLVDQWSLLSTGDHEGVVAAYRTVKGLFSADRPAISLVVLDSTDPAHAVGIHQKLSGVCQKFLDCPIRAETPLREVADVQMTVVLHCRGDADSANSAHWKVISDFLSAMKKSSPRTSEVTETPSAPMSMPVLSPSAQTSTAASARADEASAPVAPVVEQVDSVHARSAPLEPPGLIAQGAEALSVATAEEAAFAPAMASHPRLAGGSIARPVDPLAAVDSDVVDLPEGQSPELAILAAVVGTGGQFIKCPVAPPECPGSIVAVSRDKRLTLLAVAGQGLSDLRRIAAAFQWMQQNRDLIVMALPQFAISQATPQLRLLVDQADLSAGVLHPFLAGGGVTVQPYRKLRWGRKTGLLLEAA